MHYVPSKRSDAEEGLLTIISCPKPLRVILGHADNARIENGEIISVLPEAVNNGQSWLRERKKGKKVKGNHNCLCATIAFGQG